MYTCYGCTPTPLPYRNLDCPDGYADYGTRWNAGLGRITIVTLHSECSARCTEYSDPQYRGGCKGYMTGMYFGMLFCRSYGARYRTTGCAVWASLSHPGVNSGQLGSIHARSGQRNLGGSCCSNITFVDRNVALGGTLF